VVNRFSLLILLWDFALFFAPLKIMLDPPRKLGEVLKRISLARFSLFLIESVKSVVMEGSLFL